jgi:hypothetical protein
MAGLGAAPQATAQRRGPKQNQGLGVGGGGGGNNRNKPKNRQGGGAGAGLDRGLYGDDAQGEAAGNQAPDAYIRNMLTQSGVLRGTGTTYDTWADDQLQKNILDKYNAAVGLNQGLSIADFMKQTYGAGYGGKKGKDFTAGNFAGSEGTAADWDKYQSDTETDTWLNNKLAGGGGFAAGGGNQDFQAWFGKQFAPQLAQGWEAAKAAQMQAGGGTAGAPASGTGSQTTLPNGASGDFGGDPMKRKAWMRDQGINGRLNQMNKNKRGDIKSQYQDYQSAFGGGGTGAAPGTPGSSTTGANAPMSMSEYMNGRDVTAEARAAYLLRPNTQRTPSSTGLGGRYSWWE